MKTKTLYISDMDGTLLDADSRVSPESARIITDLSRDGAMISVATARTPATVVPLLRGVETTVPAIVITGAAMWDRRAGRYIRPHFMERTEVERMLGFFSEAGIRPFVYALPDDSDVLQVYHSREMNSAEEEFYRERSHLELKKFNLGREVPAELRHRVLLFFGCGETLLIKNLAERLEKDCPCSVSAYPDIFNPRNSLIEVFAPGVSKARAVEELRDHCGADRVVVFGDNLNDLSMFSRADVAVAVENAFPQVKEQADIVIGRNTADAVAKFIQNDFYE